MTDTVHADDNTQKIERADHIVSLLRERLYGAISCLTTLTVLGRNTTSEANAWERPVDILITAGGLWAASLLAEIIARISVFQHFPRGTAFIAVLRTSGQILIASVVPVALLVAAALGALDPQLATWIAMGALIVQLGLFAVLAVRRAGLLWWQGVIAVVAFTGVGTLVVAIKMLSHH
jgi:hypothetical protein